MNINVSHNYEKDCLDIRGTIQALDILQRNDKLLEMILKNLTEKIATHLFEQIKPQLNQIINDQFVNQIKN